MRLIKAKVQGYKRLAQNCCLNLDADPLCIVGPNAAGKSSFLDALVHLNHDQDFEHDERTRVPGGKVLDPRVEARFVLDESERAQLDHIPEAAEVRQLLVIKEFGKSRRRYSADPFPRRNKAHREALAVKLDKLRSEGWATGLQEIEEEQEAPPDPLIGGLIDAAAEAANDETETLGEAASSFDQLAERLRPIVEEILDRSAAKKEEREYEGLAWPGLTSELRKLPTELTELATHERDKHPIKKVETALAGQVPEFLKFDEDARDLQAEYDLNEEAPSIQKAIHSFLTLAGTNWDEAVQVVQSGNKGWKQTYLERAHANLKNRAALVWGQSDIEVRVDLDASILTILLSMQEDDFIDFNMHSDGLQQFMALRSFVWREEQKIQPIVLIDEADLHLHYDAQADLVGVFEAQNEAAQIIYTTHSAGCLPRDLGQGVRAIVPETDEDQGRVIQKDHSEAVNRFWTKGRGFSPLLLAMGAGAFAFSATQYAVITEGMSDALLLPTLIREATGEKRLRYQAAPSFAEATAEEIKQFDLIAGRIAFLADGDDGGRRHVQQLLDNGISEKQVVYWGEDPESDLAIEDFLTKSVYLNAVNKELHDWHGLEFPASELPDKGRSKAVEDWCSQQTGRDGNPVKLSKVDVAQRVLDQRSDAKLLAKAGPVKKIHERVLEIFHGAPERTKQLREETAMSVAALKSLPAS